MISKKGLPDFMKKMSDERLEELSEPRNFRQTPAKVNVEFDRKKQKNKAKKKKKGSVEN